MGKNSLVDWFVRGVDARTFMRLLTYLRPYRRRLLTGVFFGILFAGSTIGILPTSQDVFARVFDIEDASWVKTLVAALVLLICGLGRGAGAFLSRYYIEWVGNRVVTDMRIETLNAVQAQSLSFFTSSRTGDIMSRVANDTMLVERAVSTVISDLVQQPLVFLGALIYLFYIDPVLAAGIFILFPLCLVPVTVFGRRVRRFSKEGQQMMGDMTSLLQELLSGMRIVKAFAMEDYESSRFAAAANRVFGKLMKIAVARAANNPIMEVLAIVGICGIMFYAKTAAMTTADFFVFVLAFVMMYEPIKKISRINIQIQQSAGAADRIFEIIDAPVEIQDAADAVPLEGPIQSICFRDVCFAYEEEPVLRGINLEVKAGECIAIVGSSGSGKSTLVNLLPRFYDVIEGSVEINGVDIRHYTAASLRRNIGLVTQDTILFNDTIASNIAYGHREAPTEQISEAARRAHAHKFIMETPRQYDTMIGERGVKLSGGQRQRLSIARAILRNPPLLILDEATSALDTESERYVQAALNELMTDRTVFAIAHRLSTIAHADRIIVLDQGRIVEQGTHGELLARCGIYKHLYDIQFNQG